MNLLDIVPSLDRQLKQYRKPSHTDSTLAAYLADAVEAMDFRWVRTYAITLTAPSTYIVTPDIAMRDKRGLILMASIIYKSGNLSFGAFKDGDFAFDPQQGRSNPLTNDIAELDKLYPPVPKLAKAFSSPIRGYSNIFNPESYRFFVGGL